MNTPRARKYNIDFDPRHVIDLRCQGKSFSDIAKEYGTTKIVSYEFYRTVKENDFYGYEPFSVKEIVFLFEETNMTYSEIAKKMGMSVNGLKNYILDRNIPARKRTTRKVILYKASGRSNGWIADYFGVTKPTVTNILREAEK